MAPLKRVPLRLVLIVPFVLEVMAAVGVTAYFVYRSGQEAINDLANRLVSEISDRVETSLENHLTALVQITNDNAEALRLGFLNQNNPLAIQRYFSHQLTSAEESRTSINAIMFINEQKRLLAVEKLSHSQKLIASQTATATLQVNPSLRTTPIEPSPFRQSLKKIYQDGLEESDFWYDLARQAENGMWQLTPIAIEADSPSLVAIYWKPVYDSANLLRGVTGTAVDLSKIGRYLETLQISQTGIAFVVEQDGTLVATSTGETLLFEKQNQLGASPVSNSLLMDSSQGRLLATRSVNPATKYAARFLIDRFGCFDQITQKQLFSFDVNGNHYFLQVSPLKIPENLNWVVVVVIPESDFADQIDRNHDTMILLSGAAMLAAIALGLATSQLIAKPILRLSRASRDLMLGKLDVPINETTRIEELAIMAHSFNEMTEQLMQSFDQVKLALQESKEKYTTVFRTSPDPIIVSTLPDGKILEVNNSFLRLSGYSQEEVINRTTIELGLWDRLDEREEFLQLVQKVGRVYNQEVSAHTQYGTKLTVLLSSEVIELEGQKCLLTVAKDITERKQLEEALKQSKVKLQDVLNSITSSVCCFWVDLEGRIEYDYLSPSHYTLFGFLPEELLANPHLWQSRVYPADRHKTFGIFPEQFVEGTFETEYRYYHTQGKLRWISDSLTFHWDSLTNRWRVTSVAVDISDRKQLENALRESETNLSNILNSAAAAICYLHLDQAGNVHPKYFSQGVETVFGYPPDVLLKNYSLWQNRVHQDDWHSVIEPCLTKISDQRSISIEYRYHHPNSGLRWILADVISQWDSRRNCWLITIVEFDITARKETEAALRLSEERFRIAFDTAAIGMNIASLSGQLLKVNPAFCQMLRYSEAELLQMMYQDITHPDDLEIDRAINLQLFTGEVSHIDFEKRFIRKDGQIIWALLSLALVHDPQQKPLYLIAQIQDITARKYLEELIP